LKKQTRLSKAAESQLSDNTVPQFLFRYRALCDPFDSLKKILANNLWYLGSRKDFDDQEDMVLPGVVLVPEHLRELMRKRDGRLTADEESQIQQLLADPLGERGITAAIQNDLDDVGILCLSEEPNNRKLWQLYADDGKGVCLKLQSLHIFPAGSVGPIYGPFDVKYSDNNKEPYDLRRDALSQTDDHLFRKKMKWAYQKEWRFIRHRHGKHSTVGYYQLRRTALVGLIFGWRLTHEDRAVIRKWINVGEFRPALFDATLRGSTVRISPAPP